MIRKPKKRALNIKPYLILFVRMINFHFLYVIWRRFIYDLLPISCLFMTHQVQHMHFYMQLFLCNSQFLNHSVACYKPLTSMVIITWKFCVNLSCFAIEEWVFFSFLITKTLSRSKESIWWWSDNSSNNFLVTEWSNAMKW